MNKNYIFIVLSILISLFLVGCTENDNFEEKDEDNNEQDIFTENLGILVNINKLRVFSVLPTGHVYCVVFIDNQRISSFNETGITVDKTHIVNWVTIPFDVDDNSMNHSILINLYYVNETESYIPLDIYGGDVLEEDEKSLVISYYLGNSSGLQIEGISNGMDDMGYVWDKDTMIWYTVSTVDMGVK